jgi:hypothetical protein
MAKYTVIGFIPSKAGEPFDKTYRAATANKAVAKALQFYQVPLHVVAVASGGYDDNGSVQAILSRYNQVIAPGPLNALGLFAEQT